MKFEQWCKHFWVCFALMLRVWQQKRFCTRPGWHHFIFSSFFALLSPSVTVMMESSLSWVLFLWVSLFGSLSPSCAIFQAGHLSLLCTQQCWSTGQGPTLCTNLIPSFSSCLSWSHQIYRLWLNRWLLQVFNLKPKWCWWGQFIWDNKRFVHRLPISCSLVDKTTVPWNVVLSSGCVFYEIRCHSKPNVDTFLDKIGRQKPSVSSILWRTPCSKRFSKSRILL